jgi:hypothetical protein
MEPSEHSVESHGGGTGLKTYDSGKAPVKLRKLRAEFAFLNNRVKDLRRRIYEAGKSAEDNEVAVEKLKEEFQPLYLESRKLVSPRLPESMQLHADICYELKYWEWAAHWYGRYLRIDQENVSCINSLTYSLCMSGRKNEAIIAANWLYREALRTYNREFYDKLLVDLFFLRLGMVTHALCEFNRPEKALAMLNNLPDPLRQHEYIPRWEEQIDR